MIVKICGLKHEVIIKKLKAVGDDVTDNTFRYGYIDHARTTIKLNIKMSDEQRFATFIHECIHGLLLLSHADSLITEEEDFIEILEPHLVAFIRDNWKLLKKLGGM